MVGDVKEPTHCSEKSRGGLPGEDVQPFLGGRAGEGGVVA